jgi:hypothetical protein
MRRQRRLEKRSPTAQFDFLRQPGKISSMIQICESDGDGDVLAVGGGPVVILSNRYVAAAAADVYEAGIGRRTFENRVAIHESGHATSSRLLALPVSFSSIEYANGHYGCTRATSDDDQPVETVESLCRQLVPLVPDNGSRAAIAVELQHAGDQIISLLAGVEAERLLGDELLPGTEHDLEEARQIAALICRSPSAVSSYLDYARAEARGLLADHADIVLAVADALCECRTIYAAQIDAIVGKAGHG